MHSRNGSVSKLLVVSLGVVIVLGSVAGYLLAIRQRQITRSQADARVELIRQQAINVSKTLGEAVPSSHVIASFSNPYPITLPGTTITYTLHLINAGPQTVNFDQVQFTFVHSSDSQGNQVPQSGETDSIPRGISVNNVLDSIPTSLSPGQVWTGTGMIVSAEQTAEVGGYSGWVKMSSSDSTVLVSLPFGTVVRAEALPKAWWE